MKRFFIGGTLAACLLTVSSCLETGTQTYSDSNVPGVIRFDLTSMKTMVDASPFYPYGFFDPNVATMAFNDGDCILFDYNVDLNSAENSNYQTTGSIYGTVTKVSPVDLYYCTGNMRDTTALLDNEREIAYAIDASLKCDLVGNKIFLFSDFKYLTDQKTEWILYYNPELQPEKDEMNRRIYTLFLRAVVRTEGRAPETTSAVVNAFDIARFLDFVKNTEKSASSTEAYFKFNHIKEIKADSSFTWSTSDLIKYTVSSEQ
jgi:hypothetical protein